MNLLYESALGAALFRVDGLNKIGSEEFEYQKSVAEFAKFAEHVKLVSFQPFTSAECALEVQNMISEGVAPQFLIEFIKLNLVKDAKKASSVSLAVSDDKLGNSLNASLGVSCWRSKASLEVARGIRQHLSKFIKSLNPGDLERAQLGLAHSYSRSKMKFNVNRSDNMVIQSVALLDQLDKDLNSFAMRCREWYSWHFPELSRLVPDNRLYAAAVLAIGDKRTLSEASVPHLTAAFAAPPSSAASSSLNLDTLPSLILSAAKSSFGSDLSAHDLATIHSFASRVLALSSYRDALSSYLFQKTFTIAPNTVTLLGELVTARLISAAGSVLKLAKLPASTIQILGAEKALFRALKSKSNTPKYGLLYNVGFIGKASGKDKGRVSRYVANKTAMACRLDAFLEEEDSGNMGNLDKSSVGEWGRAMREQVEERLGFLAGGGGKMRKNVEVMHEVSVGRSNHEKVPGMEGKGAKEARGEAEKGEERRKEKKKEEKEKKEREKERKRKKMSTESESESSQSSESSESSDGDKKKKKVVKKRKKVSSESSESESESESSEERPKKKKKGENDKKKKDKKKEGKKEKKKDDKKKDKKKK